MRPNQRAPITPEERETMRQRRREGKSLEEIAAEFSCARMTARKICSNVLPRTFERGVALSQDKIDQIIAYRKEGRTQPDIARMVGVSLNAVSRHTPPDLKICRPRGEQKKPKRVRWAPTKLAGAPVRWSKEEIKKLLSLLKGGAKIREAAIELGRSYVSVKDKVNRLANAANVELKKVPEVEFDEKPKFFSVKCLQCLRPFESYDLRRNRICVRCKSNEGWS
jgi:DNA-binding CsgD family transcriptional regulator